MWWLNANQTLLHCVSNGVTSPLHGVVNRWLTLLIIGYSWGAKSNFYLMTFVLRSLSFSTLRPWQHGCHFPDGIFRCIFLNEDIWIAINISLNFVPKGPIDNIPALVQIMAWHRSGDKPLSEPMMVSLPTHICVTQPQWVNTMTWF